MTLQAKAHGGAAVAAKKIYPSASPARPSIGRQPAPPQISKRVDRTVQLIGPIVSAFSVAQVDASGTLMLATDWATTMAIPTGFKAWPLAAMPYTDSPADFLHIR